MQKRKNLVILPENTQDSTTLVVQSVLKLHIAVFSGVTEYKTLNIGVLQDCATGKIHYSYLFGINTRDTLLIELCTNVTNVTIHIQ